MTCSGEFSFKPTLFTCGGRALGWLIVFCGLMVVGSGLGPVSCSCDVLPVLRGGGMEVCGRDGLPYASKCLAICQGVRIGDGPCERLLMKLVQGGPSGPVYKRDMRRFERDGYRYLGKIHASSNNTLGAHRDKLALSESIDVLLTMDGGVYSKVQDKATVIEAVNQKHDASTSSHVLNESITRPLGVSYLQIYGDNGLDDRLRVSDTTYEPWRRLGFVEPSGCTGTMIGPRHVLTSAHCVYDVQKNQFDLGIKFIPALMGEQRPFGWTSASHVLVKSCFLASGLRECDFAVIVLKEAVGTNTGWFGIGLDCSSKSVHLETAGYPADKPKGTMWREKCGASRIACDEDPGLLQHNCDMTDGMSGAPLWDAAQNIRAIHRGYIFGRNIAVYITPFVFDNLLSWTSYSYASREETSSRGR